MLLYSKSKLAVKILDYFFLNPQDKRYVNELARLLASDPMNVYRKLKEFEKLGLLQSEFRGRERYFFLNRKSPLLKHYRQIFMKTQGLEKRLAAIMERIPGLNEAYIYGSFARGKMDSSSDIDILAVGDHSVMELQRPVSRLQREIGRDVNIVNMSLAEFHEKQGKGNAFLKQVFHNPVIKIK